VSPSYTRVLMIVAWVVLDHSKIYEYGGIDTTQFECQAAIDLRFASVREGRDTERRFGKSSNLFRADISVRGDLCERGQTALSSHL
jgi:hypothetical protein